MRALSMNLVAAALLVLSLTTVSSVSGALFADLQGPQKPHHRLARREGNYTRTQANVIFREFVDSVSQRNFTQIDALLHPNVTGMITGYACMELNKQEILMVLQGFMQEVQLLALIPQFHIVSERRGAFWVEDTAFVPAASNSSMWNFYVPRVMFVIELNPEQTHITRVYEFFPTAPNNLTAGISEQIARMIVADNAKNVTGLKSVWSNTLTFTGYPQGTIYPAERVPYADVVLAAEASFAHRTRSRLVTTDMYTTCNMAITGWTWLTETVTNGVAQQTVEKSMNIMVFGDTTGALPLLTEWFKFYWNEIRVTNVTSTA